MDLKRTFERRPIVKMSAVSIFGSVLAVVITLSALSFLWKENIFYRYIEHIYVGFAAAHALIMAFNFINSNALSPMLAGNYLLIIPVILGILLFLRYSQSTSYIGRWTLAFLVGGQIGLNVAARVEGNFVNQIIATILPLSSLNNIIIVIGVLTGVSHFLFNEKLTKGTGVDYMIKIGRQAVLIYLAATFAQVSLTRLTVSAGRILELLKIINLA